MVLIAATALFVYTRPVPISNNMPQPNNSALLSEIFEAKKALFVGAHPDDIEFYCGGLVYLMREKGIDVIFAVATRGGKGRGGRAKDRLEGLRSRHQLDAARILGGARVVLYDYPDKDLPSHIDEFARDLKTLIAEEKPDIIFSWDPDYIYNPHLDHQAAAKSARTATEGRDVCFYGTREPNLWLGYGEDVFRVKLRSLRAHRTETPWYFFPLAKRFLVKKSRGEGVAVGSEYAEVFRFCVESDFGQ